ncbi:MAG: thioesterase family protein [Planctomycetota bacterium]
MKPIQNSQNFHFVSEVRVRLNETDTMGIVFHGHFFTYMDVGRIDYLRNLDLMEPHRPIKGFDSAVVHASSDFVSPARFEDIVTIHIRIAELGKSSMTFEFLLVNKKQNRLLGNGKNVLVALDGKSWKPIEIPESFRKIIREFEGESLKETWKPS